MFDKEKDRLKKYKQSFDQIEIPETLDEQIEKGFMRAKQNDKKKRKIPFKWFLSVAIVAIILVGFASTKYILDFVENNRGLVDAIEHDYFMELDESKEINDVEFVIDGVIVDEANLVLFYTIHSDVKDSELRLGDFKIDNIDHKEGHLYSATHGQEKERHKGKKISGMMDISFINAIEGNTFEIEAEVKGGIPDGDVRDFYHETFKMSFELPEEILTSKDYEIDETVEIEGQEITFKEAKTSPIRTEIHIETDPDNTKHILNFDDLELIDEQGDVWGQMVEGVTSKRPSDHEHIIYLQSNYFREAEELYVSLNKVQAIDKDERFVVVDPVKEEIIKQPEPEMFTSVEIDMSHLIFHVKENLFEEDYPLSLGEMYTDEGDVLESHSGYNRANEIGLSSYDIDEQTEPVSVDILSYPAWIIGEEKIRIK